jgi:2-polyprenyl-6-methoxyphenol hydroxylase-like FAD-dependent oxidoreductase
MWRDPLPTFTRGKAVLIGDAAHLMLPTHGQGASMAMEDAVALEVIFSPTSPSDGPTPPSSLTVNTDISSKLSLFNHLRLPRVRATQTLSNKMMGDPNTMLAEVGTYYADMDEQERPVLPTPASKTYSKAYNDFFFGYDVRREAERLVSGS